jgi:RNA polymerase sigma-70 factor (ECF subfamily)
MAPQAHDHALGLPLGVERAAALATLAEAQEVVLRLFDAHRNGVHRYVRALGVGDRDGDDIVQEVFLALFDHVVRGRDRSNLRGWIFRVAHNLAIRHRAREARRRCLRALLAPAAVFDSTPTPEDRYVNGQRRARLLAVMDALPARDRRCLQLRAEGLRYREIASVLGISLGSVANTLARALARLRRADER